MHSLECCHSGVYCSTCFKDKILNNSLQVERNILATNPRVTRFKIDWDDTAEEAQAADSENVPPMQSTESESNQMAVDNNAGFCKPLASFITEINSANSLSSGMEVN